MSRRIILGILGVFALIGFLLIVYATRLGIGITPDSIYYIGGARSLLSTGSFRHPLGELITHYPPLYPLVLAAAAVPGFDPLEVSRWINALIFSTTIFITGYILISVLEINSKSAQWLAVFGAFLVLTSGAMIEIHTMAWTEPLYLLLELVGIFTLAVYIRNNKVAFLLISGIVIGLAFMTRYAGIALIGTGLIAILFLNRQTFARRIWACVIFGIAAGIPFLAWTIRNLVLAGTVTNRTLNIHSISPRHFWEALNTVSSWVLIPVGTSLWIKAIPIILGLLILVVWFLVEVKKKEKTRVAGGWLREIPTMIWLFILLIPVYVATLLVTNAFLNTYTPLESRILSPIFIPVVMLVCYIFGRLYELFDQNRLNRYLIVGIVVVFSLLHLKAGVSMVRTSAQNGLGFNSVTWFHSETLDAVRKLPAEAVLYSNAPEAIYIHTGRPTHKIPQPVRSIDQNPNENYALNVENMRTYTAEKRIAVIVFTDFRTADDFQDTLSTELNLVPEITRSDGVIYLPTTP